MVKKARLSIPTFLTGILLAGCAKPDSVTIIKAPLEGMFYTAEVSRAAGPAADTTRVYAHLERNGKTRKILVMEGENITMGGFTWNNPHRATICLDGGITNVFRNEVTLIVGDSLADSETIHHELREGCTTAAPLSK
jgi:hypothetical protein